MDWWMDKSFVVYALNGMLLSNKKEWANGTRCNTDESQNIYTKWKKPDKKEYTV